MAAAGGRDSLSREIWRCMLAAKRVCEAFQKRFGREPTDAELRVGLSFFIEYQRSGGRRALASDGEEVGG